jgi:hypothetical protein
MRLRWAGVLLGFVALAYGTVMVFRALDQVSHSASDTLRPFVITMGPVWVIAVAGAAALLRRERA